jgi:hypothetical protein
MTYYLSPDGRGIAEYRVDDDSPAAYYEVEPLEMAFNLHREGRLPGESRRPRAAASSGSACLAINSACLG